MPNKTIYVSEGDLSLFQRAQELAGGNLSAAIAGALKRYVDAEEGLREGFDDVVVRVGVGAGRKVRFTGVLVGEWLDPASKRVEHYRVWRGRKGKYVVHVERAAEWWTADSEGKPVTGWRSWMGVGDVRYGSVPKESTLDVCASLDELRDKIWLAAPDLFEMVARSARHPSVEELDI